MKVPAEGLEAVAPGAEALAEQVVVEAEEEEVVVLEVRTQ